MEITILLAAILLPYFIGSISFARIVSRIVAPEVDIHNVEMDIPGTDQKMKMSAMGGNTVSMKLGPRVGCTIGMLDILKGFLPTLAFRYLYPDDPYFFIAATFAMVGHNWPIFYKFKGGRGVSTFYGGFFAIDWIGALVTSTVGMIFGMVVLKDMLVAFLAGLWLIFPWMWLTKDQPGYYLLYGLAVNIIFTVAMIPDIRNVIAYRKEHGKEDIEMTMDQMPMGRGMKKIMDRFRLLKKV
ncbi:MAG: glycerol-3-phosphate acyltransferase [Chloroflexi bacterium]|nr:MAG: glycerol-3-phosphate acyltransferase [Chloroflexota bacterium]